MFKAVLILAVGSLFIFFSLNENCIAESLNFEKIQDMNVDEINISVILKPIKNPEYCYNYKTTCKNEIIYIIHQLNSLNLIDDNKKYEGADVSFINVNIIKNDSSQNYIGFMRSGINYRFYINGKQYGIDNEEYTRVLQFVEALKTGKLIFDKDVTFEISEWAKPYVNKAIENRLIPKYNSINYQNNITRLEVCQIINNFIINKGYTYEGNMTDIFLDTHDKSVINLCNLNIISGKSENLFCPYDLITKEELSKILLNTYYVIKGNVCNENKIDNKSMYKDIDKVSNWALDSVNCLTILGVLKGNANNEFEPMRYVTKEETIVALLNLYNITIAN